jgi:NADH dehydrogenase
MKHVLIVGGGFAGLNAAKVLGRSAKIRITLIDRRNHHLFQPLLYQVAMAALSPAEIASPIRSILSEYPNISVVQGEVLEVRARKRKILADIGEYEYDYLILACGARHSYFGHESWEKYAPGLKNIEQATEIRRRVLTAFEDAERENDVGQRRIHLTFVIVGGGPTGVELAGAIGELSRFTLAKDFRAIDPKHTRIVLIEAGPRILPSFSEKLSNEAAQDLENLGVQIRTSCKVTQIDSKGVEVGGETIPSSTVIWAAGVQASSIGSQLEVEVDNSGRIIVGPDLSLKAHSEIFVAGDQANFSYKRERPLPGLAPVALQQGRHIAKNILRELEGKAREHFKYIDKGQMATIGRSRAIFQTGSLRFHGRLAWLAWIIIHIYYLTGFKNRLFVTLNWAWSYLTFQRGARLIVGKNWRFYEKDASDEHSQ